MDSLTIEERIAICQKNLESVREKKRRLEESSPRVHARLQENLRRFRELRNKTLDDKGKKELKFVRHQIQTYLDEKEQIEKEYADLRQRERGILLEIEELKNRNSLACNVHA